MAWHLDDDIVALGSASGPAPRGILRASGPQVASFLQERFCPDDATTWHTARVPRRHVGRLKIAPISATIPLTVHRWSTARSYTGQPLVELHLPGSPPLLQAVLTEWCQHGARLARPGEFTLRAFLAGKLDLLQAEAVLGVIDADDPSSLRQALEQLAGGISHRLTEIRHDLLNLLADVEAGLDFVEEHLEFVSRGAIFARIATARSFVEQLAEQTASRMHHAERPRIVLAGLPNAGKSTLFNALAGSDAALVSEQAGTTRDFLETRIECDGVSFDLIDTAGWEHASFPIAAEAQRFRTDQLARADIVIWCTAANATVAEQQLDMTYRDAMGSSRILPLVTKADLVPHAVDTSGIALAIAALPGHGLDELRQTLAEEWRSLASSNWTWLGTTAARCQDSVQATLTALQQAEAAAADPVVGDELIAVELRDALEHLGRIVGAVYTDDLLDRIFSRFCIGK